MLLTMQVWLELTDQATEENDTAKIIRNVEAQHRYLTWRSEKVCIESYIHKLVNSVQRYLRQISTAY